MRKEARIIITQRITFPNSVIENGIVEFDLGQDFDVSETENTETLSLENLVSLSYALTTELPKTPKNDLIFQYLGFDEFSLMLMCNQHVLKYSKGHITKNAETYSLGLKSDSALTKISDVFLKDLDFGVFDFTLSNFIAQYQAGISDLDVFFPIVDFGGGSFDNSNNIALRNFRPFFKESTLIQKAFERVGYTCNSQLFSIYDSSVFSYICGSFRNSEMLNEFAVQLAVTSDITPIWILNGFAFDLANNTTDADIVENADLNIRINCYDKGVNALRANGYYNAGQFTQLSGKYVVEGTLFLSNPNSIIGQYASVYVLKNGVSQFEGTWSIDTTNPIPISFSSSEVEVNATDTISLRIVDSSNGVQNIKLHRGSNIKLKATEIYLSDTLKEPLSKYISPNLKAIELIKGFLHKYNAVVDIDENAKIVTLRPMYSANTGLYNSAYSGGYLGSVEGYYNNISLDLTQKQIVNSAIIEKNKTEKTRYLTLKYQNDIDTSKLLEKPHEKTVDFGAGYGEKREEYKNPFFFATITRDYNNFEVGYMSNSESGISHNISPRTVILGRLNTNLAYQINGQNITAGYIVTAYQKLRKSYNNIPAFNTLAYGNSDFDLYSIFYYYYFTKRYNSDTISALFLLSIEEIRTLNKRYTYVIYVNRKLISVRILAKKDMRYNSEIPQLIEFESE